MKRMATCLMALLLLCALSPWGAAAQAEGMQPLWTYVTKVIGTITISSGGTAKVTAEGAARSQGVTKTTVTASLQQFKDGKWQEIKSWTISSNGTSTKLSEKSWPVAHGYNYRVVATTKAYAGTTLLEQGSYTANYGYFK